jgi:predicted NAD/FAD-binding protein
MIQFQRALQSAKPLVDAFDSSVTVEQFIEGLRSGRSFKDEFCYPMLQSIWGIDRHDVKHYSAYNALKYYVLCDVGNFSQFYFTEVVGGSRAYIQTLTKALTRARLEFPAGIQRLTRQAGRYAVELADGSHREFDHLIIATSARDAYQLITPLDQTEALRNELGKFEYFKTTIAVHGDTRLMPANRKHWSVFNIRHDGDHSALTIWKRWKSEKPVFKSWVTHERIAPDPLYHTATYDHPAVRPVHFETQQKLARLQGLNNLWLAGMYTHDIDSHESAILSAVKIAERLSPQSSNLNRLR